MPLDYKSIARELIAEIASKWTDTPSNRCVLENGSYIFVLTLEPNNDLRLTSFDPNVPASILYFNPLIEATEIVALCANDAADATEDAEMLDSIIRSNAETRIGQMLLAAPDIFSDALFQLRVISTTFVGVQVMNTFGKPDKARALIDSALRFIEERLRQRFGRVSKGRNPKINNFSIHTALRKCLPKFKSTGQLPSRNQFAKALGVTPKAWRDFVKEHPKADHDLIVKEWLENLHKHDSQ
jgi:hypothetical protein